MNHSFNVDVACKYGVSEAIILENINFWISKNRANNKHFHDGDYWTYNSVKAFVELFPYWTERQIQRILKKLEAEGLIKTGNYNKINYDRTKWYALTQKAKSIYANCQIEEPKKSNQISEKVEPIPDINTNIKTDIYAEFKTGKIFLTLKEKNRLLEKYENADLEEYCFMISQWANKNNKTYKSIYQTLNNWIKRDVEKIGKYKIKIVDIKKELQSQYPGYAVVERPENEYLIANGTDMKIWKDGVIKEAGV